MAETTNIEWADATLNFWIGCTKVSPACDHCYAETWGARFGVKWGVGAQRRRTVKNLAKAKKIERRGRIEGRKMLVFSNSLSDIFDNAVPIEWLADAFAVMRATPGNIYLLLTKRPGNIIERAAAAGGLPSNCAIGCTVVNQEEADRDLFKLAMAWAAARSLFNFVSIEPMLGPIDLTRINQSLGVHNALTEGYVQWVIVGGESGAHARPVHPGWVRSLRDQCAAADVPFLFKQWGEWIEGRQIPEDEPIPSGISHSFGVENMHDNDRAWRVGKKLAGRMLDGCTHDGRPEVDNG